jgi:hypothetical protein
VHVCSECLYVDAWWLNLDGEQYYDDQEYYFEPDQQYLPENFDQGKYNMGPSLLFYSLKLLFIYMCPP